MALFVTDETSRRSCDRPDVPVELCRAVLYVEPVLLSVLVKSVDAPDALLDPNG